VPFIQKNISPFVAENPQVAAAIALAVGGALLLLILELVGNIKKSH
jgi:hypothetical protein